MSKCCEMTLSKNVTGYGEIGRTKLGEIRRTEKMQENQWFQQSGVPQKSPDISPKTLCFSQKRFLGKNWGKFGKSKERMSGMRKVNYKGRCTKRKLSKCKDVCRTFDVIQLKAAEILQANDDIKAFRCNVCLEGVENNQYHA